MFEIGLSWLRDEFLKKCNIAILLLRILFNNEVSVAKADSHVRSRNT